MRTFAVSLGALALVTACASESEDVLPVSTEAGGQTSRVPAAAEAARRDSGFVRLVHAIPEVPSVDCYADDMKVLSNVAYATITAFHELPEESYDFRIRPAGQNLAVPLAEEGEGIDEGKHYTLVAFRQKKEGKANLTVFADDLTPPKAGFAKLRVINASPDAGELDVFLPGAEKAVFTDVDFEEATGYENVKPMTGRVQLNREDETTALANVPTTTFDTGKVYTLVVVGWAGGAPVPMRTIIVEDRFGSP